MTYYCDTSRHLICVPYSVENLHQMAAALDIKRCWYHKGKARAVGVRALSHYDMPERRIAELTAKCTVVSSRQLVELMRAAA
jgi:hypothetical protein